MARTHTHTQTYTNAHTHTHTHAHTHNVIHALPEASKILNTPYSVYSEVGPEACALKDVSSSMFMTTDAHEEGRYDKQVSCTAEYEQVDDSSLGEDTDIQNKVHGVLLSWHIL